MLLKKKRGYNPPRNLFKLHFYIPPIWKVLILKNHKNFLFYFYSSFYKFSFFITSFRSLKFNKSLSLVTLSSKYTNKFESFFFSNLKNLIYLFSVPLFRKLKFKGKGYYIYKNIRNTIAPKFGYYHKIYIYGFFSFVKFLSKTKILVFGFLKSDIITVASNIKKKRPINIFTGRGVRFCKQVIYKKVGKVSDYKM